jgi:hypothetical protein
VISFIIATTGREYLGATLRSIDCWPTDEILVVGEGLTIDDPRVRVIEHPRGNDWGHSERNYAMKLARCPYIAHIDDDDTYTPWAREAMHGAIIETPNRPIIFRMRYHHGQELWIDRVVKCGNVGTPMSLLPNDLSKIGTFGSFYGGDAQYLETMKWSHDDIMWRPEVTVLIRPHLEPPTPQR